MLATSLLRTQAEVADIALPGHPAMRLIAPRLIIAPRLPFQALFLLFWLWRALAVFLKCSLCTLYGLEC
ncbi:hypothetical protein SCT_1835 [Sulfuricella sp. T08]|uniref:hypothetical protein n=1 Tax=Sulfuricella sp. T08 TaxID=1632857 RepID=UPI0006179D97|nr:hypothetical protein [Sulfuricella sp. T08]GAO36429.1 hypothetical protein SCT_1835 [Sulfuricella sp. T08]